MICGILSVEQKDLIKGQLFASASYFNPVQDAFNNWVIFEEEMTCQYPEFSFVNSLPLIEFVPIIEELPFIKNAEL
jgi:hypothetical protein